MGSTKMVSGTWLKRIHFQRFRCRWKAPSPLFSTAVESAIFEVGLRFIWTDQNYVREDSRYKIMSKKKIIHARLEAIPFARYTVECQAQIEKESGLRGGRRLPDRSNMMGFMDEGSGLDNS